MSWCSKALTQSTAPAWPRHDDVALLVEIADTSYAKDSGPKLRRYATFRIPVYWIVDLNRRIVEVRYQPFGKGKQAGYARCEIYLEHDHVPVVLAGNEVGRIAVANCCPELEVATLRCVAHHSSSVIGSSRMSHWPFDRAEDAAMMSAFTAREQMD